MRCLLCGFEFDETRLACHATCAFNKHCRIICCPNCGYQVVDESRSTLARAARRAIDRILGRDAAERRDPAAPCRLSDLRPGQPATVVSIESQVASRLDRLTTLGVVPGCRIRLEQRYPACVVRVGFTELSLEREVADEIVVAPG